MCLRCLILQTAKIVKRDHFTKSTFLPFGTVFFCTFAAETINNKSMENPTLEQKVKSIIDQIRPYLQQDGGDIEFVELTPENVVKVKLQGACGSCPHAKMTLKNGVEQTIKHYLPEIDHVEDVILGF